VSRFGSVESMFSKCPIVTRFSACWASFQDKVGRTLGRTHQTRHDFDSCRVLFKCSCADFEVEVQERETWEIKGGNFRVESL